MGQLRFRLPKDFAGEADLRLAYVTGQDRSPARAEVSVRDGVLVVAREAPESGRLHVPWPVRGHGRPVVATATLAERPEPYNLAVELARGKLNDVRNQLADWQQMGLAVSRELAADLHGARRAFARAATSQDQPEVAAAAAAETLAHAFEAGRKLAESYTEQVLRRRLEQAPRLPTLLACGLGPQPKAQPWGAAVAEVFNAGRIRCGWAELMPDEGKPRFDEPDLQLHFCRKRHLAATAGPLIDLRPGALPDWLWLWQGDFDQILQEAVGLVRQAVGRYRGKVAVWHVVARPASSEVLGLGEEEQIRLTARLVQVARAADPDATLVVDFDRPWAEWLAAGRFQLGPLHLADSLARADLGLGGVGLEVAPGFAPYGSRLRDLFEFSRLLDLYALINLPLHVGIAVPSAAGEDPRAGESIRVEARQWPRPPDEALQREWAARWVALAAAKPFVRSVTWLQPSDAEPHLYPHAGLFRPDGTPKPLLEWLRRFRREAFG
jgi:hypothetical protein